MQNVSCQWKSQGKCDLQTDSDFKGALISDELYEIVKSYR